MTEFEAQVDQVEDELRFHVWEQYFKSHRPDTDATVAVQDLRRLVRYITYLRATNANLERESVWNWNSFALGSFGTVLVAIIYLWVAHYIPH